jgi:hypothetical protein
MSASDPLSKRNSVPDCENPGTDDLRPASDDAIAASIRDWSERLREVEAIREAARPGRETAAALDDLHRLRALGMESAERNERQARGLLTMAEQENATPGDTLVRFVKVARSVRQIVVLEQETMGLRPMPERRMAAAERPSSSQPKAAGPLPLPQAGEGQDGERERSDLADRERDDLDDLYDYDDGPLEQVLAGVRKVLRVPASAAPVVLRRRDHYPPPGNEGIADLPLKGGGEGAGWDAQASMRERRPP